MRLEATVSRVRSRDLFFDWLDPEQKASILFLLSQEAREEACTEMDPEMKKKFESLEIEAEATAARKRIAARMASGAGDAAVHVPRDQQSRVGRWYSHENRRTMQEACDRLPLRPLGEATLEPPREDDPAGFPATVGASRPVIEGYDGSEGIYEELGTGLQHLSLYETAPGNSNPLRAGGSPATAYANNVLGGYPLYSMEAANLVTGSTHFYSSEVDRKSVV